MTKKKILTYLIIFILAVWASALFRYFCLYDPAEKLAPACKMVLSPQCQQYVIKISNDKKYEEAVEIQKIRIKENESVLKFFKSKISDKCLLEMNSKQAEESLKKIIETQKGKTDYYLLKTAEFTVKDILTDSLAVAQIQYSEFKDTKAAQKTLRHAQKVLKQNNYVTNTEAMLKLIEKELSEIKKSK